MDSRDAPPPLEATDNKKNSLLWKRHGRLLTFNPPFPPPSRRCGKKKDLFASCRCCTHVSLVNKRILKRTKKNNQSHLIRFNFFFYLFHFVFLSCFHPPDQFPSLFRSSIATTASTMPRGTLTYFLLSSLLKMADRVGKEGFAPAMSV
jgi:hypothetical protein